MHNFLNIPVYINFLNILFIYIIFALKLKIQIVL